MNLQNEEEPSSAFKVKGLNLNSLGSRPQSDCKQHSNSQASVVSQDNRLESDTEMLKKHQDEEYFELNSNNSKMMHEPNSSRNEGNDTVLEKIEQDLTLEIKLSEQ